MRTLTRMVTSLLVLLLLVLGMSLVDDPDPPTEPPTAETLTIDKPPTPDGVLLTNLQTTPTVKYMAIGKPVPEYYNFRVTLPESQVAYPSFNNTQTVSTNGGLARPPNGMMIRKVI